MSQCYVRDIPRVHSVADYVARRLAIDWLPAADRASLGIHTLAERVNRAGPWLAPAPARAGMRLVEQRPDVVGVQG